jgi:cAMP-dependent protein kinase regulator
MNTNSDPEIPTTNMHQSGIFDNNHQTANKRDHTTSRFKAEHDNATRQQKKESSNQLKGRQPLTEKAPSNGHQTKNVLLVACIENKESGKRFYLSSSPPMYPMPDLTSESEELDQEEAVEKEDEWAERRRSMGNRKKMAISAEVFCPDNIKSFKPKVIYKSHEQRERIKTILNRNFMFNGLEEKDQNVVIDATEIKDYKPNEYVIRQGDDGDALYIVGTGLLKCQKKFNKSEEDVFLRNYSSGEVFGELALMYNVPRAASIIAVEPSQLFSLDRTSFNAIVKFSVMQQRERYDQFLAKIDILNDLNIQEKSKLADCLVTERFAKGDFVIKENEFGDKFYLIQKGAAEALKLNPSGSHQVVFDYKENDYFGELALLSDKSQRKASIRVTSDRLVVASIDRESFKRLLGPIEGILQRNQDRYQKYVSQNK